MCSNIARRMVASVGTPSDATAAPWTPDMARSEARRILGEVTKGNDPAGQKQETRKAATIAEHCDAYLEASEAGRVLPAVRW
jgi:hypothetical protein